MATQKRGIFDDKNVNFFKGYLGNERLKPPGVVIDFTEEQAAEYIRCAQDPIYFIRTYVNIISLDKGIIPYDMWDFQEEWVNRLHKNRFNIAKWSRQIGKTTSTTSYILWYILFHGTKNVAILAHKLDGAVKVLAQLKQSYELLPKWLQQGVVKWNERSILLENGSKVFAAATQATGIRGEAVNLLYLDEFAFVPHNVQLKFFESVYPTLTSGTKTKIIMTSTPNGLEMFFQLWMKSVKGENEYVRTEAYWHMVPGRDEAWKEQTIRNTSALQFRQEFDCEFIGSANTLIDGTKLGMLLVHGPEATSDSETLHIFERPTKGHQYAMTVDVAQGVGGDYSAFSVIDISSMPYRVVCTYANNDIQPMQFPEVIWRTARAYNEAAVLIELNDNGDQVANILHYDFEYEHVFVSQLEKGGKQEISGGFGKRTQLGVKMTKAVKRTGCSTLKTLIEMDKLLITDERIRDELANFIEHGTTHKAAPGYHDDLTMTLVIFAWLTLQPYFMELTESDTQRNVRMDSQRMFEQELTPFGDVITGLEDVGFTTRSPIGDEWERRFNQNFYGRDEPVDLELLGDLKSKYLRDDQF